MPTLFTSNLEVIPNASSDIIYILKVEWICLEVWQPSNLNKHRHRCFLINIYLYFAL